MPSDTEALAASGAASESVPESPGLGALFAGFFRISILGFGGVLPWARRMVVEQRGWLTPAEFNDLLALCQFLPGPNIINVAVALGARFRGWPGSVTAVVGLLAAPMVIVIGLGGLYEQYGHLPVVARGFAGLSAAASGLVVAMAVKMAGPLWRNWAGIGVAVVAFVAVALLRLPLLPTMLVLAPIAVVLCRRFPA
jgi:chromate transporter